MPSQPRTMELHDSNFGKREEIHKEKAPEAPEKRGRTTKPEAGAVYDIIFLRSFSGCRYFAFFCSLTVLALRVAKTVNGRYEWQRVLRKRFDGMLKMLLMLNDS